jgi:hypothetical protein
MTTCPCGFRVVGPKWGERQPTNAAAALAAYAAVDPIAQPEREAYLSAFTYPKAFLDHVQKTSSTADYTGECMGTYLWFDLDDAADARHALDGARRLAAALLDRYRALNDDGLLLFFSGDKGFHVGLPTALWQPAPRTDFHRATRRFAEAHADRAGATIDRSVYGKAQLFRAPNSRHPNTGLYKRRLSLGELMGLSVEGIRKLASLPEPFDLPSPPAGCEQAEADWQGAVQALANEDTVRLRHQVAAPSRGPRLNRLTLEFIREGAAKGDRHRLLFSAAANLGEFRCPPDLARALLTESALDSGLPPSEVLRQIECGLRHAAAGGPTDSPSGEGSCNG